MDVVLLAFAALLILSLVPPLAEGQLVDEHNARRNGTADRGNGTLYNTKFDTDGVDDWRVDADIAVLDKGMWEAKDQPSLNLVHRVDCVNPDPRREEQLDGEGNPQYTPPDPEDPDWEPNERVNKAAQGDAHGIYGSFGCLDHSGSPYEDQLSPTGGIHGVGVGDRAAMIDGEVTQGGTKPSLAGMAPGARIWSVRTLASGSENWGEYIHPITYPVTISGDGFEKATFAGGYVKCADTSLQQELPERTKQLQLEAESAECHATESKLPVSVDMQSCHYTLALTNAGPPYTGTLGVVCAEAGDAIEYRTFQQPGGPLVCTTKVGPQQGLKGLALSNVGEVGPQSSIEVKAEVSGVKYESWGSQCGGTQPQSYSNGTISGQTTLTGANEAEPQAGLLLVGKQSSLNREQPHLSAIHLWLPEMGHGHATAGLEWVADREGEIDVAEIASGCAQEGHPVIEEAELGDVACDDTVMDEVVQKAIDNGVVITLAAGNQFINTDTGIPRNNPDVMPVSLVNDVDGVPGGLDPPNSCGSTFRADARPAHFAYGALIDMATAGCGGTSGASGRLSGAAAALASQCDPEDRAGVEFIVDTLMAEGDTGEIAEGGWLDDSGDGWKEPLLDLSDEDVFDPRLINTATGVKEAADPDGCEWRSHIPESDVNGDGRSDLVTIDASEQEARVYAGTYEGPHEAPRKQGFELTNPVASQRDRLDPALLDGRGHYAIDVADVDGDRHADLVTGKGGEATFVHRGTEQGTFAAAVKSLPGGTLTFDGTGGQNEAIAVADVTGDGRSDLVSRFGPTSSIMTFAGQEDGSFGTMAASLSLNSALLDAEGHYFLDVVDVTGEVLTDTEAPIDYNQRASHADLVTMSTDGTVRVYPGKADGKFSAAVSAVSINPVMDDGVGEEPVGLGDVDRDRRADLLTLAGKTLKLYRAKSDGTFAAPVTAFSGEVDSSLMDGTGEELIGLLDYSRDGLADLVSVTAAGKVRVYAAQRNLSFAAPVTLAGTLPALRADPHGQEPVAEKPFLRRAGCDPTGCIWDPPARTPGFHSTGYPVNLAGDGFDSLTTKAGTVSCKQSTLAGPLSGPAAALDLSATHAECSAGVGIGASVTMNSCRYVLGALNAGPPYQGALAVACAKAGEAIEFKALVAGKAICTTKVGPQQGLKGIGLATVGAGTERGIEVNAEANGVAYQSSGTHCATTTATDGVLKGKATLTAKNSVEAQAPVYLVGKARPLGLFAAGQQSAEAAKQPRLEAESYPLAIAGDGLDAFATNLGTSTCKETVLEAELAAKASQLTLEPEDGLCTSGELPASVTNNSCRYVLSLDNAGPPYKGKLGVSCAKEGDGIEFKTFLGEAMQTLVCKAKLLPQAAKGTVSVANTGTGTERGLSLGVNASGLQYELSGTCNGGKKETRSDGVLSGNVALGGVG